MRGQRMADTAIMHPQLGRKGGPTHQETGLLDLDIIQRSSHYLPEAEH